jgi:hypothetical protein
MKSKVALIELGRSHTECLYSQFLFLSRKYDVEIICNSFLKELTSRIREECCISYFDVVKNSDFLSKLKKYLISSGFDKIIFNSIQEKYAKKLALNLFFNKLEIIGLLHRSDKLSGSFSFFILSFKIKKYFVLHDYLLQNLKPKRVRVKSFYAVFYPKYELTDKYRKKPDEVWITVPGSVEFKRRDYFSLLEPLNTKKLGKNIKIIFLGRYMHRKEESSYVNNIISQNDLANHFILFPNSVENEIFFSVINQTDYFLPLIHLDKDNKSIYDNQISGTFNLSIGFKKIMLIEDKWSDKYSFTENTIIYKKENLIDTINELQELKKPDFHENKKFSLENQAISYNKFLDQ